MRWMIGILENSFHGGLVLIRRFGEDISTTGAVLLEALKVAVRNLQAGTMNW